MARGINCCLMLRETEEAGVVTSSKYLQNNVLNKYLYVFYIITLIIYRLPILYFISNSSKINICAKSVYIIVNFLHNMV